MAADFLNKRQSKNLIHNRLILPGLPQLFQLLFQLFRVGKAVDEIEPVAFHPADGTPGAAEELGIAVVEVVQIAPQLGFGGSGAAQCLAEESRVCNDAPADHDAGKGGKFRFQRMELPCGGDITVVADRQLALGQGGGKGLPVCLPAVELAHDTGVNGQGSGCRW